MNSILSARNIDTSSYTNLNSTSQIKIFDGQESSNFEGGRLSNQVLEEQMIKSQSISMIGRPFNEQQQNGQFANQNPKQIELSFIQYLKVFGLQNEQMIKSSLNAVMQKHSSQKSKNSSDMMSSNAQMRTKTYENAFKHLIQTIASSKSDLDVFCQTFVQNWTQSLQQNPFKRKSQSKKNSNAMFDDITALNSMSAIGKYLNPDNSEINASNVQSLRSNIIEVSMVSFPSNDNSLEQFQMMEQKLKKENLEKEKKVKSGVKLIKQKTVSPSKSTVKKDDKSHNFNPTNRNGIQVHQKSKILNRTSRLKSARGSVVGGLTAQKNPTSKSRSKLVESSRQVRIPQQLQINLAKSMKNSNPVRKKSVHSISKQDLKQVNTKEKKNEQPPIPNDYPTIGSQHMSLNHSSSLPIVNLKMGNQTNFAKKQLLPFFQEEESKDLSAINDMAILDQLYTQGDSNQHRSNVATSRNAFLNTNKHSTVRDQELIPIVKEKDNKDEIEALESFDEIDENHKVPQINGCRLNDTQSKLDQSFSNISNATSVNRRTRKRVLRSQQSVDGSTLLTDRQTSFQRVNLSPSMFDRNKRSLKRVDLTARLLNLGEAEAQANTAIDPYKRKSYSASRARRRLRRGERSEEGHSANAGAGRNTNIEKKGGETLKIGSLLESMKQEMNDEIQTPEIIDRPKQNQRNTQQKDSDEMYDSQGYGRSWSAQQASKTPQKPYIFSNFKEKKETMQNPDKNENQQPKVASTGQKKIRAQKISQFLNAGSQIRSSKVFEIDKAQEQQPLQNEMDAETYFEDEEPINQENIEHMHQLQKNIVNNFRKNTQK